MRVRVRIAQGEGDQALLNAGFYDIDLLDEVPTIQALRVGLATQHPDIASFLEIDFLSIKNKAVKNERRITDCLIKTEKQLEVDKEFNGVVLYFRTTSFPLVPSQAIVEVPIEEEAAPSESSQPFDQDIEDSKDPAESAISSEQISSDTSSVDDRSECYPTLGNGNCAFNAAALGICELSERNQLDEETENRRKLWEALKKRLGLSEASCEAFKTWLRSHPDLIKRQVLISPDIRAVIMWFIDGHKPDLYNTYEEAFLAAYGSPEEDTFRVHKHIIVKFTELNQADKELANEELKTWWRNIGFDAYLGNMALPATPDPETGSSQRERWGSEVELTILAIMLDINISYRTQNSQPRFLGIGHGRILDLTPEDERLLRDYNIGSRDMGGFYFSAKLTRDNLYRKLAPIQEHIKQNVRICMQQAQSQGHIDFPSEQFSNADLDLLEERNIIIFRREDNSYVFVNDNAHTIDRLRIEQNLEGISPALSEQLRSCFKSEVASFAVEYLPGHWNFRFNQVHKQRLKEALTTWVLNYLSDPDDNIYSILKWLFKNEPEEYIYETLTKTFDYHIWSLDHHIKILEQLKSLLRVRSRLLQAWEKIEEFFKQIDTKQAITSFFEFYNAVDHAPAHFINTENQVEQGFFDIIKVNFFPILISVKEKIEKQSGNTIEQGNKLKEEMDTICHKISEIPEDLLNSITDIPLDPPENQLDSIRWQDEISCIKERFAIGYDLCVMSDSVRPERNKLYLRKLNNHIAYTVITPTGEEVRDIHTALEAPEPFTLGALGQLKRQILEITSKAGHTWSIEKSLFYPLLTYYFSVLSIVQDAQDVCEIHKEVEYDLCLMSDSVRPERNKLYLRKLNNHIAYTVITPTGEKVCDICTALEAPEPFTLEALNQLKNQILDIVSEAGHIQKEKTIPYRVTIEKEFRILAVSWFRWLIFQYKISKNSTHSDQEQELEILKIKACSFLIENYQKALNFIRLPLLKRKSHEVLDFFRLRLLLNITKDSKTYRLLSDLEKQNRVKQYIKELETFWEEAEEYFQEGCEKIIIMKNPEFLRQLKSDEIGLVKNRNDRLFKVYWKKNGKLTFQEGGITLPKNFDVDEYSSRSPGGKTRYSSLSLLELIFTQLTSIPSENNQDLLSRSIEGLSVVFQGLADIFYQLKNTIEITRKREVEVKKSQFLSYLMHPPKSESKYPLSLFTPYTDILEADSDISLLDFLRGYIQPQKFQELQEDYYRQRTALKNGLQKFSESEIERTALKKLKCMALWLCACQLPQITIPELFNEKGINVFWDILSKNQALAVHLLAFIKDPFFLESREWEQNQMALYIHKSDKLVIMVALRKWEKFYALLSTPEISIFELKHIYHELLEYQFISNDETGLGQLDEKTDLLRETEEIFLKVMKNVLASKYIVLPGEPSDELYKENKYVGFLKKNKYVVFLYADSGSVSIQYSVYQNQTKKFSGSVPKDNLQTPSHQEQFTILIKAIQDIRSCNDRLENMGMKDKQNPEFLKLREEKKSSSVIFQKNKTPVLQVIIEKGHLPISEESLERLAGVLKEIKQALRNRSGTGDEISLIKALEDLRNTLKDFKKEAAKRYHDTINSFLKTLNKTINKYKNSIEYKQPDKSRLSLFKDNLRGETYQYFQRRHITMYKALSKLKETVEQQEDQLEQQQAELEQERVQCVELRSQLEQRERELKSKSTYCRNEARCSFKDQMEHDKKLIHESLSEGHLYNSLEKRWAFARFLYLIQHANPEFCLENEEFVCARNYPIESLLCHTLRFVISVVDMETSCRVINWLMTGEDRSEDCKDFFKDQVEEGELFIDRKGKNHIKTFYNRSAATHTLMYSDAQVKEEKSRWEGITSLLKTIVAPNTITDHWGMDIGIGELGQDDGCWGHIYVNICELETAYALQVGIESSAPLKHGPAGQFHDATGKAAPTTITGGKILNKYKDLAAELGGKLNRRNGLFVRNINRTKFEEILSGFGNLKIPLDALESSRQADQDIKEPVESVISSEPISSDTNGDYSRASSSAVPANPDTAPVPEDDFCSVLGEEPALDLPSIASSSGVFSGNRSPVGEDIRSETYSATQ